MSNKEIEKQIYNEISNEVPDVLTNILLNCEKKEKKLMKNKKNIFNIFMPYVLAMCLLIVVGVFGLKGYNTLYKVDSVVAFDVNPSIEIKVNSKERIIYANPINEDGKKILNDMNLKNTDLTVGVNAIIGSMYKEGYINDSKNSLLISVQNKDKDKALKLQKELSDKVNSILDSYSIKSSVITQEYERNNDISKKAEANGISKSKAEFIERIIDAGLKSKDGTKYTFETLSKLSINELNVILNSKNTVVKNTSSTGTASTKSYIGVDKAKSIALNNANVSASSARNMEVELDYENGRMVYEISFDANNKEYDYDIDAITGSILDKEIDIDDDDDDKKYSNNSSSSSNNNSNNTNTNNTGNTSNSKNYIGYSKAKSIALNNAGVSSSMAREMEVDLDYENGRAIYEISFKSGNKEYDYDIDAITGNIVDKSVEEDD